MPEEAWEPLPGALDAARYAHPYAAYSMLDPNFAGEAVKATAGLFPVIGAFPGGYDMATDKSQRTYGNMLLEGTGVLGDAAGAIKAGSVALGGIMAGERARNATHGDLEWAKEMGRLGSTNPDTAKRTGWWLDEADGQWRFEIDDSQVQIMPEIQKHFDEFGLMTDVGMIDGTRLSDVIDHPELFNNYPELADIRFSGGIDKGSERLGGSYSPGQKKIHIIANDAEDFKSKLIHEIQHAVQEIEDFPRGGNPEVIMRRMNRENTKIMDESVRPINEQMSLISRKLDTLRNVRRNGGGMGKTTEELTEEIDELYGEYENLMGVRQRAVKGLYPDTYDSSFREYEMLAGETEARNAARRLDMSASERGENFAWDTQDVQPDEVIVTRDNPSKITGIERGALESPSARGFDPDAETNTKRF